VATTFIALGHYRVDASIGDGLRLIRIRGRGKQDDPCIAQRPNPLGRRDAEVEADDLGLLLKEDGEHVVILNEAAIDLRQAAGVGDGRRQSGRSSARHRRLDNGPLDIEKFEKMCGTDGHYVLLTWRSTR
jgi:hypothetical protein